MKESCLRPVPVISEGRKLLPLTPVNNFVDVLDSSETIQEECGIISFYNPNGIKPEDVQDMFMQGMKGIKHRGPQGAGFVFRTTEDRTSRFTGTGKLEESIPLKVLSTKINEDKVTWMMGHTRYGTTGGYAKENIQPCTADAPDGTRIFVAHNGNFSATEKMRSILRKDYPEDISDTYLFTKVLAQMEGHSWDEKIAKTMDLIPGAASVLIGIGETLYAARDKKGIRPFVIGQKDGTWMTASETLAFDKAGAEIQRELLPGEIVKFDTDGMTIVQQGSKEEQRECAWEGVYFMKADSLSNPSSEDLPPSEWVENRVLRRNIGLMLAKEENAREEHRRHQAEQEGAEYIPFKPDIVVPIPQSGIPFGEGYAAGMGIPLMELITKVTDERQFLDQDVEAIQSKVSDTLRIHNKQFWNGKVVVLVDDSIVRGSVSKGLTQELEELGAVVHWRSGLPMIMDTCHLGVSIREEKELIAARNQGNEEAIAAEIGAATVYYITNEGFNRGRRGELYVAPSAGENVYRINGLCGGCFTSGESDYPYTRETLSSEADIYIGAIA